MKLAIMQPYFFPYIGYFQLLNKVDKFVFFEDVNFIKRGWINRNRILVQGTPSWISVPLVQASIHKKIQEIEIENSAWSEKMLKTISFSYSRAKSYSEVFPLLEKIICSKYNKISDLARMSVVEVFNHLQIKKEFISSTAYGNQDLKGEKRILDICRKENATAYFNLIGGKDLYRVENFSVENIQLNFVKTGNVKYSQGQKLFFENLSIVDVLMHNTRDQLREFLINCELC